MLPNCCDLVVNAALEEAVGRHGGARALDIAVDGEDDGVGSVRVAIEARRDEAGVGNEERAHAIPVAGLTPGAGDDVVERS